MLRFPDTKLALVIYIDSGSGLLKEGWGAAEGGGAPATEVFFSTQNKKSALSSNG
jgi:hypothetical protein